MPRYFTHYWRNSTWDNTRFLAGEAFKYTADNSFRQRNAQLEPIIPGDPQNIFDLLPTQYRVRSR